MRILGLSLLAAGWFIVLCALALLRAAGPQGGFVLAGVAVEVLGLVLMARSHLRARKERK